MDQPRRHDRIIGIFLIALGIYFLAADLLPRGGLGLALLGALLLAGYGLTDQLPGLLIAGFILLGLGLGVALTDLLGDRWWPLILLGLGFGFCAISTVERRQGWALVPGGILVLLGGLFLLSIHGVWVNWEFWNTVGRWWPVVLVAIGLAVLWRELTQRR